MGMDYRTPTLVAVDSRSRPVRSVDYCRSLENDLAQRRINRSLFDLAGRAVKQWDPRLWAMQDSDESAPTNLSAIYSLSGVTLRADGVDAGRQIDLPGLAEEGLQGWDSRGTQRDVLYDESLRPVAVFEQGDGQPRRCTERLAYGDPGHGDQDHNQYGQLIRHDDTAGTLLLASFALTGQNLMQNRRYLLDAALPDWPEPESDREQLLEPGSAAVSTWRVGPLSDVLERVDARGNRQRQRLTLDGRLSGSQLLLAGQGDWQRLVSDVRYDALGQIEGETAGNGVQTTLVYSPADGRLAERQAVRAGQVLQHLRYVYDPMGNVLSIEDAALAVRYFANQRIDPISRFVYDSLYQLIKATGWEAGSANQGPDSLGHNDPAAVSNYQQTYRYDEGGNLLALVHVGAQSHGRDIQAARYSNRCLPYRNGVPPTEDEIAAAFDARGNGLELDAGRFLAWDLRNQLGSVTPIERASELNDREAYVYDSGGQRVRKLRTLQTGTRTLTAEVRYLPGLELRADSGTGEALQVVIAEGGLSDVRVLHWESAPPTGENDGYRFSMADHLGSVCMELALDGRIISREHFYPFGETASLAGDDAIEVGYKTVRYSGKERDATGLYYYGFRYYTPWLQRWMNPDPAGAVDGLNRYRMVRNNPVGWFDDDGLMPVETGNGAVASGVAKKRSVSALRSRFESQTAEAPPPATYANLKSRFESRTAVGPPPATFANTPEKGENGSTSTLPTGIAFRPLEFTESGEEALSTSDVSMSFKPAKIMRNGLEVSVERLVVTFKKKFDLVEGKSLPEWPRGYELLPSQDWANESGIKEYEKFHVLEGAERERAVALIKAKDQAALKVGLGTPTYAYDSEAKIITLKDGHHRFIAAARLGRTIELDSSRVLTSKLKWKNLKFSAKQPLKV
ncbi:RHS repeat domain-containing protein [Pseudomonas thivervalensis]|uniref:RHS repeat domain-containing protein n=1 Tax=Pseudomonas thivervalensis TaxID=86265 RepID=UPI00069D9B61|nr:RHS repeat-associated core domain-containing protein [Pseudomonas thivervalensis]OAB53323.1 type IV secretion protein Rhs [Pseudomonas thivervalensis]SDG55062.1 insecticidal toxin complex protein TccC [Pseudomonas thivervalensis]